MAVTVAPIFGSSTNTTSPSWSWANAVMPIRARSPSTFAHSCSRVYLRSGGTCAIFALLAEPRGSDLALPGVGRMEWGAGDARRLAAAPNLHRQLRAHRGEVGPHVGHADPAPDGRPERSRRDRARGTRLMEDRVPVAGHRAVHHLEPDQLPRDAARADAFDRAAADEVALGGLDDPAESRLEGARGLVDVV